MHKTKGVSYSCIGSEIEPTHVRGRGGLRLALGRSLGLGLREEEAGVHRVPVYRVSVRGGVDACCVGIAGSVVGPVVMADSPRFGIAVMNAFWDAARESIASVIVGRGVAQV